MPFARISAVPLVALISLSCSQETPTNHASTRQNATRLELLQRAATLLDGAADAKALRAAEPELEELAKLAKDLPPLQQSPEAKAALERIASALKRMRTPETETHAVERSLGAIYGVRAEAGNAATFAYPVY